MTSSRLAARLSRGLPLLAAAALCPAAHAAVDFVGRTSTGTVAGEAFNGGPGSAFNATGTTQNVTGPIGNGVTVTREATSPSGVASVAVSIGEDNSYLEDDGTFFGAALSARVEAARSVPGDDPSSFTLNGNNETNGSSLLTQTLDFDATGSPQPYEFGGTLSAQNNGSATISLERTDGPGGFVYGNGITGDFTSDPVGLFSFGFADAGSLAPGSYRLEVLATADVGPQNFGDIGAYGVSFVFVPEPASAGLAAAGGLLLLRRRR